MTTEEAAAYLSEHLTKWGDRDYVVFNPYNKPIEQLPVIYGFNNGGTAGFFIGILLSEDGTYLGDHMCSDESYMERDLGVIFGTRKDRHEGFQQHYPEGYRMDFVSYGDVREHTGLMKAVGRAKQNGYIKDHP